jgi:hypothetical protein
LCLGLTGTTSNVQVYNALRLLQVAQDVLDGQSLRLWWDGEAREGLMAVRRGQVTLDEALDRAKEAARRVEAHKPWTTLAAEKADVAWLEAWLLALRTRQWSHKMSDHL